MERLHGSVGLYWRICLGFVAKAQYSPWGYAVITTNRRLLESDKPTFYWFEYFQRLLFFTQPYLSW